MKVYIRNSKEMLILGQPSKITIECDRHPANAIVWVTREQAEHACRTFASLDHSTGEGSYRNFRVEEISAVQFVVACDSVLA